jgi:hypothetical protein
MAVTVPVTPNGRYLRPTFREPFQIKSRVA